MLGIRFSLDSRFTLDHRFTLDKELERPLAGFFLLLRAGRLVRSLRPGRLGHPDPQAEIDDPVS